VLIYRLSFLKFLIRRSIKNASVVDIPLLIATNSSSHRFTVFSPNDSYITGMPNYGQDILFNNTNLLKSVTYYFVFLFCSCFTQPGSILVC